MLTLKPFEEWADKSGRAAWIECRKVCGMPTGKGYLKRLASVGARLTDSETDSILKATFDMPAMRFTGKRRPLRGLANVPGWSDFARAK